MLNAVANKHFSSVKEYFEILEEKTVGSGAPYLVMKTLVRLSFMDQ